MLEQQNQCHNPKHKSLSMVYFGAVLDLTLELSTVLPLPYSWLYSLLKS